MRRWEIRYENSELPQRYGVINSHRPVVLLNDPHSETVQVVPLTTNTDKLLRNDYYHISISSSGKPCVALVDQIRTVPIEELGQSVLGQCTLREMRQISAATRHLLLRGDQTEDAVEYVERQCATDQSNDRAELAFKLKMIRRLADETLEAM